MADQLESIVDGHRRRNAELEQTLLAKGVNLSAPRDIDLRFFADGHAGAIRLGKAMYERGYLVTSLSPTETRGIWTVEARKTLRPLEVTTEAFVREIARTAADCGARFDGWGTLI